MKARGLIVIFALSVILLSCETAFGKTISETRFSELGYDSFVAEAEACKEYLFSAGDIAKEQFFIVSIHAEFLPVVDNDAFVEATMNDELLGSYKAKNFKEGWLRIIIDREKLQSENLLKLCLKPTEASLKIIIDNDSFFGKYEMPYLYAKDSVVQEVSKEEPYVGEKFEVYVTLRNYGSENAQAKLKYSIKDPEEVFPYLRIVKGELEKEITVEKCRAYDGNRCIEPGSYISKYEIKPEKATDLLLRAAVLSLNNVFGEAEEIRSNRSFIRVRNPELNIDAGIYSENNLMKAGDKKELILRVENNSPYDVYGLNAIVEAKGAFDSKSITIGDLEAGESFEKEIIFAPSEAGKINVGCSIISPDYNSDSFKCKSFEVIVEEKSNYWVIAAIIMLAIAIGTYVYINKSGEKKETPEGKVAEKKG